MSTAARTANRHLKLFGLFKAPLIYWSGARVVDIDANRVVVRIPLRRRTKNHLGSMYFGILAVGADVAGGLLAAERIRESGQPVSLVFKDFKAEFHKRPCSDTLFTCGDGATIREMVAATIRTGERVHRTVEVVATCPETSGDEPVATFALTLSVKHKPKASS